MMSVIFIRVLDFCVNIFQSFYGVITLIDNHVIYSIFPYDFIAVYGEIEMIS